jgi:aryl-alcohol dehydrogenase-like predicted oxidoreductase
VLISRQTHAWEFQNLQNIAEKHNWHKFISMQNYHNLLYREEEREMIPYCKATGVGLIPWSPIARGILARPWSQETHRAKNDQYVTAIKGEKESDKEIVGRVEEIAKKRGVSMAVVAIAWTIKKGDSPIVGLGSIKRIDEAVDAVHFELSDEEAKYLEEPYVPKAVFGIEI